jgi:DNA-binding MarR family transcriptional regulator
VRPSDNCKSMLEAVRMLQLRVPGANLTDIVTFLCVCENEGASVKELAFFSGTSTATVSRSINYLARSPECGPAAHHGCLFRMCSHPHDGRRGAVFLTDDGRQLKRGIELLFSVPESVSA